jgi:uncharacterized small protein (DUF1192 family)
MALDTDDAEPRALRPKPTDLTGLSIEELEEYIAELKAEIVRAEAAIAAKRRHRDSVQGLFKTGG